MTELLTTSDIAYSKAAGYELDSYEKEEGDTDGPFALAVSVEAENGGQMIWFASSHFLDEMYNAYSSGANLDLAMNAMSSVIGENEAVAIRGKSLKIPCAIRKCSGLILKMSVSWRSFWKEIPTPLHPTRKGTRGSTVIWMRNWSWRTFEAP